MAAMVPVTYCMICFWSPAWVCRLSSWIFWADVSCVVGSWLICASSAWKLLLGRAVLAVELGCLLLFLCLRVLRVVLEKGGGQRRCRWIAAALDGAPTSN